MSSPVAEERRAATRLEAFSERHIGTDSVAQLAMLDAVGYDSVDALMDAAVPAGIRVAASPAELGTTLAGLLKELA